MKKKPIMARVRFLDPLIVSMSLVLGGYLLATSGVTTQAEESQRAEHLLSRFSAHKWQRIVIKSPANEFAIVSDDSHPGKYYLGEDSSQQADPVIVREITSALEFATWKRRLASAQQVPVQNRAGVPVLELSVTADNASYELQFWGRTQISSQLATGEEYVSVTGQTPTASWGVVPSRLLTTLDRPEQEFRGNQLFPFSIETTLSLEISGADQQLQLVGDDLGFRLKESNLRADRELTDLLFYQLARAQITAFVTPAEAKAKVMADEHHITVTQRGAGQDVVVVFGGSCPDSEGTMLAYRQSNPPIAGCVTQTILSGLNLSENELTDRSASIFSIDEIDHVVISGKQSSLDLIRKDADFVLVSREQTHIPAEAGTEFLEILSEAQLQLIPPPSSLTSPSIQISITGNPRQKRLAEPWQRGSASDSSLPDANSKASSTLPSERRQVLDIYSDAVGLIAHRIDDNAWLRIPSAISWAFTQDDSWARPRELLRTSPDELSWAQLEVVDPEHGFPSGVSSVTRKEGVCAYRFIEKKNADHVPDQSLCRQLFEQLAQLTALRFLPQTAPNPTAPHDGQIFYRIRFGGDDPKLEHELIVGSRVRGGYLAWSSLSETPFVLPYEVGLSLPVPLLDRSAARIEPDDFSALTIVVEGRRCDLKRIAGQLVPTRAELPKDITAPIEEALRGLTPLAHINTELEHKGQWLTILGQMDAPLHSEFELTVGRLVPYQDGLSYPAYIRGQAGMYIFSAASVQALRTLL